MRKLLCLLTLVLVVATQTALTQPAEAAQKAPLSIRIKPQTSPIYAYDYGNPWDDESGPYAPAVSVTATIRCEPGVLYSKTGSLSQDGKSYGQTYDSSLGGWELDCGSDGRATFSLDFYGHGLHPGKATATLGFVDTREDGKVVSTTRTVHIPKRHCIRH